MKVVTIGNKEYSFFDNIKETPEFRWQKAQIFIAHESGIGSSMDSIPLHYSRFFQYISAGKVDLLAEEANNLYFNWNSIINKINYKSLCLVSFIESIDKEPFLPITDDDYLKQHHRLLEDGITNGMLDDLIEEIKKKLMMN